jgi:Glu-tRNA(Gln) amidotransferase subunit E-like FAD-binding protein
MNYKEICLKMNYKEIGLKAGLEIHQQLDTKKLFCNCPGLLRKDEPDFEIKRKLHVVAGESGEVDIAARHEAGRGKEFTYQGYDTTCLVELDEEPPHQINEKALEIAVQISLLLSCKINSVSQIMRKTVIDGSNTGGFQRTVLVGRDGYVETESGRVGIWYVYLEEDAARKIGEGRGGLIFRLDRLGIPLVEIVTAPDIKTPEQAKEVALHIGEILRSCKVKRGIGTIRQDINVSIKKHPRAEIKGFQDPKIFIKVIEKEIERQQNSIGRKLRQEVRGANPDASTKFLRPLPGVARMYPETDLPLLKISKKLIDTIKKNLPRLKHDVRQELIKDGLSEELARLVLQKDKLSEFKELIVILKKPNLIAKMIVLWREEIISHKGKKVEEKLNTDLLEDILQALRKKKIGEKDVKGIMKEVAGGKKLSEVLEKEKAEGIEEEVIKLLKEKPGLSEKAYMGLLMKKFKGRVSGKELIGLIRKHIK